MYEEQGSMLPIIIIAAVVVVLVLIAGAVMMTKLYKRATKEVAFVRTGLGGEKVVKDGGAIVIGMFHEVIAVNMQTIRIEVSRTKQQALISRDRMRLDVTADFYVRVKPNSQGISMAAQTLGTKTMRSEELKALAESKFVDVLRSVAAEMTMFEMHEQRSEFVQKVQASVANDLEKNGLELETVSLTGFDQTELEFFNENNAFDAEGRARLAKIIEDKRKETNDITQATRIEIEQRDLDAEKESLTIKQAREQAELDQKREVAAMAARQRAEIARAEQESQRDSDTAEIERQQAVEAARIENSKKTEQAEIERQRDIEVAEQQKAIILAEKSEEENAARAKAAAADKDRVEKEEAVITARELAAANRAKEVAVTQARQEAEEEAQSITVRAEAEKQAAADRAEARRTEATANRDAALLEAEGLEKKMTVEAMGTEAMNNAKNTLSEEQIALQRALAQIEALPKIVEESVKPLTSIEGIKILQGWGAGSTGSAVQSSAGNGGNMADQLTNAALSYRANAPLVDSLLQELGLVGAGKGLEQLVSDGGITSLKDGASNGFLKETDVANSEETEDVVSEDADKDYKSPEEI
tara:strand:+ start:1603 stop:3363 length:1761 start_codon:yes stop_codon:yes gene_type:complete